MSKNDDADRKGMLGKGEMMVGTKSRCEYELETVGAISYIAKLIGSLLFLVWLFTNDGEMPYLLLVAYFLSIIAFYTKKGG